MIPNGCDVWLSTSASMGDESFRQAHGISPDQLLAVYCGTHGLANGLDAVIDAAVELQKRGRDDIVLALIGRGHEKPQLVERAEAAGLRNLRFVDPVSKMRLFAILAEADIGMQILKNIREFAYGTSPNKFFDYLSAGLPVLNNYPGWLADLIREHDIGFAIAPDSPVAFADALEQAANDRAKLTRLSAQASALAHGALNRERLARQWVAWVTEGVDWRQDSSDGRSSIAFAGPSSAESER
jgi:glycosyltransferase involved in cell wall biosynthesis